MDDDTASVNTGMNRPSPTETVRHSACVVWVRECSPWSGCSGRDYQISVTFSICHSVTWLMMTFPPTAARWNPNSTTLICRRLGGRQVDSLQAAVQYTLMCHLDESGVRGFNFCKPSMFCGPNLNPTKSCSVKMYAPSHIN